MRCSFVGYFTPETPLRVVLDPSATLTCRVPHPRLAVSTTHAHMSVFRAIENGVSLVRHADNGLSIATDPYGRVLASLDHFSADRRLMVVEVPTAGVTTIYSIVGDLFGWIAGLGFLTIVVVTAAQGRIRQKRC